MNYISKLFYLFIFCISFSCAASPPPSSIKDNKPLVEVTPDVMEYVSHTVSPVIAAYPKKDKLSLLLKVSEILIDPEIGVDVNRIKPSTYIIYDKLDKIKLGSIISFKLSSKQKNNLRDWHSKYMQNNPADVFFAPSADEVIRNKAAFGCSHFARAFIAVVKALGMINNPENLRYAISCKSDDYNQALEKLDGKATINGHQFVMIRIDSKWIAINTSKGEWTAMPEGFSPELIAPPDNVPVRFASYPGVTLLLRKIGNDYDDDCNDNSLTSLMNIYRSGNAQSSDFKWEKFVDTDIKSTQQQL
jgi:hypothetical protein